MGLSTHVACYKRTGLLADCGGHQCWCKVFEKNELTAELIESRLRESEAVCELFADCKVEDCNLLYDSSFLAPHVIILKLPTGIVSEYCMRM